jgi:hypothetical protein
MLKPFAMPSLTSSSKPLYVITKVLLSPSMVTGTEPYAAVIIRNVGSSFAIYHLPRLSYTNELVEAKTLPSLSHQK